MSTLVEEWLAKAEGDFTSAVLEYRARKRPNFDAAGFHAQQCIEKYLKALLQKHRIHFEKIHDLLALKELAIAIVPELELYEESLAYLNRFAVTFRYPGEFASRENAKHAVKAMKELRLLLRGKLNLLNE